MRQRAHQRLVEGRARALLDQQGVEPVTDPVGALQQLAGEVLQLQRLLREQVARLSDAEWVSRTRLGVEQASAWVSAYERALDRSGRLLEGMARIGLDERAVRLSEQQGALLAQVLRAALEQCGVADREDLLRALAVELRRVGDEVLANSGSAAGPLLLARGRPTPSDNWR